MLIRFINLLILLLLNSNMAWSGLLDSNCGPALTESLYFENSLLLEPTFSEWKNDALIKQTQKNLKYFNTLPYSYPDIVMKVNSQISIKGWPGAENHLHIRVLKPEEIQGKVFRFFTTRVGLAEVHLRKRLITQKSAYNSGPYYYSDLTGVLLSLPEANPIDIDYLMPEQRFWVDVTLSKDVSIVKIDENTFLIPGASQPPEWLVDKAKSEFIKRKKQEQISNEYAAQVKKMSAIGWSAMEIPIENIFDSSDSPQRAKNVREQTVVNPEFKDAPLFEMFYGYYGEELKPGSKKVDYISDDRLNQYQLKCSDDGRYSVGGMKVAAHRGAQDYIGVLLPNGKVFMSSSTSSAFGEIFHSSFNHGKPVLSAFKIIFEDGKPIYANNESGHYLPTYESLKFVKSAFERMGCDVSGLVLHQY